MRCYKAGGFTSMNLEELLVAAGPGATEHDAGIKAEVTLAHKTAQRAFQLHSLTTPPCPRGETVDLTYSSTFGDTARTIDKKALRLGFAASKRVRARAAVGRPCQFPLGCFFWPASDWRPKASRAARGG